MFKYSFYLLGIVLLFFIKTFTPFSILLFLFLSVLLNFKEKYNRLKILRFPLLVLSIALIYLDHGTWRGLSPSCTLLGALSFIKLFEYDKQRDYFSFVLIFQLFVLSIAIQVEDFYFLAVIAGAIFFSFNLLYRTFDHDLGKVSIKYLSRIMLKSIPLMLILLTFFPRFQFGGIFFTKNFAKTGFSNSLVPGEVSRLINDTTELFTSEFSYPINRSQLYWRGAILTKNNHFSWEKGKVEDTYVYTDSHKGKKYSVTYSELWNGPLFTLADTSYVLLKSKSILRKKRGGVYSTTSLMDQKLRFIGTINSNKSLKKFSNFNETYLTTNVEVSKKLQTLLDSNKTIIGNSFEVSALIEGLFFKDFVYSLNPGEYDIKEGLDDFLFNRKIGFCGHFTTASAILFRLFKIPSRVVIGYQGGEYNNIGNFYTVTKKQAHAWVEYLDRSGSWVRFDPVSFIAPQRIEFGADAYYSFLSNSGRSLQDINKGRSFLFSKLEQFVQNLYYQAGTKFFNYDIEFQKNLFKGIKKVKLSTILSNFTFLLIPISLIALYKISFINLVLYLVLRKSRIINGWNNFKYISLSEIRDDARCLSGTGLRKFISKYEVISYTKRNGVLYKLSFIFDGFKILLYEKSI